jgi:hypothetical protein
MNAQIAQHLASPNISLEEHVQRCQTNLVSELGSRKAIYLDVKYWVILRDVVIGRNADMDGVALLDLLQTRVAAGQVFCPVSESTFMELLKQGDPTTRMATARLIDELSLGVSLIPFNERILMEMECYFDSIGKKDSLSHPEKRVWSKLSYVLGHTHPSETGLDAATELAVQKAFFDHMWTIPLVEIVQTIGGHMPPNQDRFDLLAQNLNQGNKTHSEKLRSFQQTYAIELAGALDLFSPMAATVVRNIAERALGRSAPREGAEWDIYVREMRAYLTKAFKRDEVKVALRTLHIHTCLHASVRWNKKQQLDANDFYDFHHAAAAVGYCDTFLTEHGLRAMVTAKHVALNTRYDCKIAAGVRDAVELVRQDA